MYHSNIRGRSMATLYLFSFSVNIKLVLNIESINKNKQTKNNENLHQGVLGYEQEEVKGCGDLPAGTDRTAQCGECLGYSRASCGTIDSGRLETTCQSVAACLRHHALVSA